MGGLLREEGVLNRNKIQIRCCCGMVECRRQNVYEEIERNKLCSLTRRMLIPMMLMMLRLTQENFLPLYQSHYFLDFFICSM